MSYSKVFEVTGEDAIDYITAIDEHGPEYVIEVFEKSSDVTWNSERVYEEIPNYEDEEEYRHNEYVLTWETDTPKVCVYIDGSIPTGDLVDPQEDIEDIDYIGEAFGERLTKTIRELQEGSSEEFERLISQKTIELTKHFLDKNNKENGEEE